MGVLSSEYEIGREIVNENSDSSLLVSLSVSVSEESFSLSSSIRRLLRALRLELSFSEIDVRLCFVFLRGVWLFLSTITTGAIFGAPPFAGCVVEVETGVLLFVSLSVLFAGVARADCDFCGRGGFAEMGRRFRAVEEGRETGVGTEGGCVTDDAVFCF